MCGMKLLIHSQTSTVQPLMFGNGSVSSSHTLLGMWLLNHAGLQGDQDGVTKPVSSIPSISPYFNTIKVLEYLLNIYWISIEYHVYILTDVTAALLQWHLSNGAWFTWSNLYFCTLEILCFGWNTERSFSCNSWPQGPDASLDNMMFTAKWHRT